MKRITNDNYEPFPYTADALAPRITGIHPVIVIGRPYTQDEPQPDNVSAPWPKNRGAIIKGTIGDTDYVDCSLITYGVLAGDS